MLKEWPQLQNNRLGDKLGSYRATEPKRVRAGEWMFAVEDVEDLARVSVGDESFDAMVNTEAGLPPPSGDNFWVAHAEECGEHEYVPLDILTGPAATRMVQRIVVRVPPPSCTNNVILQ